MKIILTIIGVILLLAGIVWILQGINVLPGSMMSGHIQYSILGIVVGVSGALMIFFTHRRVIRSKDKTDTDKDQVKS